MREEVKGLKDCAIECFKKSNTGCQDGVKRKKTTLRVIELSSDRPHSRFQLGPVTVEEYEV